METILSDIVTAGLLSNLPQKFAHRRADSITKLDMVALRKSLTMRYDSSYASSVVTDLLHQLEFSVVSGETRETELFGWRLPLPSDINALLSMLEGLSFRRKQALIVAALSGKTLEEVVSLRHGQAGAWVASSASPEITRSVLKSAPRYIFSDLVFWETDNGRCWPMLNLSDEILRNLGIDWPRFASAVRTAISK